MSANEPLHDDSGESTFKSWLILFSIAGAFLAWGFFLFFTIGDRGPIGWDFSVVEDIPGKSAYSTRRNADAAGLVPDPMTGEKVPPQHVNEPQPTIDVQDLLRRH